MKKYYPIEIISHPTEIIYLPKEVGAQNLKNVSYGTISLKANCLPQQGNKQTISISQDLADSLMLPNIQIPLHVFTKEQTLYLGPLVGIFTSGFTPFPMRPIGERSLFFSKLLSVTKRVGAHTFVFGEEHINWETGTIKGLFYLKNGWQSIEVPFPNVIYDRLPNRRSEKRAQASKIKQRLETEYLIPWYNPGFFNKLEIFERLQQDPACEPYLPETHLFTSFSLVERMLADYGHVFIKPKNGSLGLGITQILFDQKENVYYARFRERTGENRLRKFNSLEALCNHLFKNQNLSHLIVQQGIHAIRVDQRTVDFRVHTNKDDKGGWRVTAIAAKVGSPGSVTTHINNGGTVKTVAEIIPDKKEQEELLRKLKKACLILSQSLEEQLTGIVGEVGFDMGVDRQGRIWLYEANSKPGRSIFKHPQLKEFDLLTSKFSLAFSIFLTEKAILYPEEIFT